SRLQARGYNCYLNQYSPSPTGIERIDFRGGFKTNFDELAVIVDAYTDIFNEDDEYEDTLPKGTDAGDGVRANYIVFGKGFNVQQGDVNGNDQLIGCSGVMVSVSGVGSSGISISHYDCDSESVDVEQDHLDHLRFSTGSVISKQDDGYYLHESQL